MKASPSVTAARVIVQALAALGVRDAVLSPGSRSAPLAYALAEAADNGGVAADETWSSTSPQIPAIGLHVRIDERSAGFLALGLARGLAASGELRPVAIVTTSGTAVANLHPAVLEAYHSGIPLIVISADRPHELRGVGANQTTVQPGIFASAVRFAADVPAPTGRPGEDADLRSLLSRAVAAAVGAHGDPPGPVHLNVAFRDPLTPGDSTWPPASDAGLTAVERETAEVEDLVLTSEAHTVVVAGDGAGAEARELAEAHGWPLLAEPSSGARSGRLAIGPYRILLGREDLGGEIRRAIVVGRPTLSRPVQTLIARDDVDVVAIGHGALWTEAPRGATHLLRRIPRAWLMPMPSPATPWLARWLAAAARAESAIDEALRVEAAGAARRGDGEAVVAGPALARAVAASLEAADVLVVGSSNPIRDLDLAGRPWPVTRAPLVIANRGLAGIDGTVSTAVGVALALPERRVRALLGDLTFLHDVGGLLRGTREPRFDLQVIVANDDGGSIFTTLEHGEAEPSVFERVFATPQGARLAQLCAGYGVAHTFVNDLGELRAHLSGPPRDLSVLEVAVDRSERQVLHERIGAAVAAALDA